MIHLYACRLWFLVFVVGFTPQSARCDVPVDFPRFVVPGHEKLMGSVRQLYWEHFKTARPAVSLWDEWLPNAILWPAMGDGAELNQMRDRWRRALVGRVINEEGYVHTHQHDGLAHAEGWPFPLWTQAGGVGWHFRGTGITGYDAPLTSPEGWALGRAMDEGIGEKGWLVELIEPNATVAPPAFAVNASIAPWLRLNWWASGLDCAKCYVEWTTDVKPEFSSQRRVYFKPASVEPASASTESRTMIPVYRHPGWNGVVTGIRVGFENAGQGRVVVKSFHTACDTRHNVNNLNFIRGCRDYFLWTRDVPFLREQIVSIRKAMRFVEREFQTREKNCIYTTWPGHEGRSGVRWIDGRKEIVPGEGIGSNYWDLLPFGGEDALATIYYYDTLLELAALEEAIAAHPEWQVPGTDAYGPHDLRLHAAEVKEFFGEHFWNKATGRFATVDLDGVMHDYGFTFLNNEAVALGIATPEQAEPIHAWLSGKRTVKGDTSTGADIYHWRFGPRSTTRRNIDYYVWVWSAPESIPWGFQVQDGGAVLGWSYYDLMARLDTAGPDDAASRLAQIAGWFDDTRAEGGYRAYYANDAKRGTLQGGNVPGGLGIDKEFRESILVPQVMLYGFLGFRPTADGFAINPRLPSDWPKLTITRIHLHNHVLDVTATGDGGLTISGVGPADEVITIHASPETRLISTDGVDVELVYEQSQHR